MSDPIIDQNALILAAALRQIVAPVEGGAIAFLAEAIARREALKAAAASDGIEAFEDAPELLREADAAEAERFRIEIERDARLPDEDQ